jgi:putative molybdopterin biosynthesis protein
MLFSFASGEDMVMKEMMSTKDVAEYLDIHEKQVYAIIKAGKIPATKVTGKWIFPRKLIDEWIESNARTGLKQAREKSRKISGALLASGSNDPILDMLLGDVRRMHPDFYVFSANTGSTDGLGALNAGYTDIALTHLVDAQTGEYNIPYIEKYLPDIKPVVVHLFRREIGFLEQRLPHPRIRQFEDLARGHVRFVNRQRGAGTRVLLDYHLGKLGIDSDKIIGYDREVSTHLEVGLAILSGEADTGIATGAMANLLGLSFVPITDERFDMVADQSTYFGKGVQTFIEMIRSAAFSSRVAKLGHYDFKESGKILYTQL